MSGNGPSRDQYEDFQAEYTEIRFMQMRWASKAAKVRARYENMGGDPEDLKIGYELGKMDNDKARARVLGFNRVARWAGVVTVDDLGQGSFAATFEEPPAPAETDLGQAAMGSRLSIARAHMDGWNSGAKGKGSLDDNPFKHAPGSREFGEWAQGFGEGMEDRKPEKVKPVNPEPEGEPAAPARGRRRAGKSRALEMAEQAQAMDGGGKRKRGQRALPAPEVTENDKPGWQADRDFHQELAAEGSEDEPAVLH